MLEDGVLSYYKIHGPDKIAMSPSREKSVKVIGEESLSYVKKANWNSKLGSYAKQWKPSGEIHLKVCSDLSYPSIQTEYNYSFDPIHLIPSVWFSSLMNYNCSIMVFVLIFFMYKQKETWIIGIFTIRTSYMYMYSVGRG